MAMNIVRILIAVFILFFSTQAFCQESTPKSPTIPTVPIFKTLCIEDKATGFNWKSGDWIQTNFKAGDKLLIQKIDMTTNSKKPIEEQYIPCQQTELISSVDKYLYLKACYSVRNFGVEPLPGHLLDGEMCYELLENNNLKSIMCQGKGITFHPNGDFIQTRGVNIDPFPKDGYKDSLVLSVGKCSRLE